MASVSSTAPSAARSLQCRIVARAERRLSSTRRPWGPTSTAMPTSRTAASAHRQTFNGAFQPVRFVRRKLEDDKHQRRRAGGGEIVVVLPGQSEMETVFRCPDQRMRIKQDHRKADQSEGAVAGSKGSSYFTTVPRIIPMNAEYVSSDAGTGDSTATGRPRFVIVTVSPSRFISLMMRRHLALNREAVQGTVRVPLRVVGERAELSRRGPRPWRGERESARRRARGRGAPRGTRNPVRYQLDGRSQPRNRSSASGWSAHGPMGSSRSAWASASRTSADSRISADSLRRAMSPPGVVGGLPADRPEHSIPVTVVGIRGSDISYARPSIQTSANLSTNPSARTEGAK